MSHTELIIQSQSIPDGVLAILARYSAIVDNPQAFLEVSQKPLPVCVWHNPRKGDAARLQHYLTDLGIALEPVAWMPGAWRAASWANPGQTLAFTAGWYYVQEEIAMAAIAALDPQPGERILDLCAAPGGKTAQIATRLGETGCVVANEMHAARLPSLSVTVSRMGLTQVLTLQADGRSLNLSPHSFDRVLVDVPCSGEGNLRRRCHPRVWQPHHGLRIAAAQRKLLSRALDLVKPGGTVVYSTCTFAPEENEAVLDAVIGDRAIVEPFKIPGLYGHRGLIQWQGAYYRHDLTAARRYFPHFNNTGGFFVAKLRRTAAQTVARPVAERLTLAPVSLAADPPIQAMAKRFAIDVNDFDSYRCWATGKRRLWLATADCMPASGANPQTLGIPLATHTNLGLKPSTAFLQRFGERVKARIVELPNAAAAIQYVQGRSQLIDADVEPGYVHVRFRDFELGCGRYRNGWLESQLPKARRWAPPQERETRT